MTIKRSEEFDKEFGTVSYTVKTLNPIPELSEKTIVGANQRVKNWIDANFYEKDWGVMDKVLTDEDGEQFWISDEDAASFEEAYELFVAYWRELGIDHMDYPKASDIESWTGRWRFDEGEGVQEWIDDKVKGSEWYYIKL